MKSLSGRRPFRLWMSGSLAVLMASWCAARLPEAERAFERQRLLRHSRYGVNETVRRIEHEARQLGLGVLARLAPPGSDAGPVIVLASSAGGTPVVMRHADSAPELPMAFQVQRTAGGDVVVLAAARDALPQGLDELPAAVAHDLAALPGLLERALG